MRVCVYVCERGKEWERDGETERRRGTERDGEGEGRRVRRRGEERRGEERAHFTKIWPELGSSPSFSPTPDSCVNGLCVRPCVFVWLSARVSLPFYLPPCLCICARRSSMERDVLASASGGRVRWILVYKWSCVGSVASGSSLSVARPRSVPASDPCCFVSCSIVSIPCLLCRPNLPWPPTCA